MVLEKKTSDATAELQAAETRTTKTEKESISYLLAQYQAESGKYEKAI